MPFISTLYFSGQLNIIASSQVSEYSYPNSICICCLVPTTYDSIKQICHCVHFSVMLYGDIILLFSRGKNQSANMSMHVLCVSFCLYMQQLSVRLLVDLLCMSVSAYLLCVRESNTTHCHISNSRLLPYHIGKWRESRAQGFIDMGRDVWYVVHLMPFFLSAFAPPAKFELNGDLHICECVCQYLHEFEAPKPK